MDKSHNVIIMEIITRLNDLEPMVFNIEDPAVLEKINTVATPVTEGAKSVTIIKFKVVHTPVKGLTYSRYAKRGGITMSTVEEVLGSFEPNTEETPIYEAELPESLIPSGFFARAQYSAVTTISDEEETIHLQFPWIFEITR
jgi:Rho GDP-dissociation inhibitor